MRMLAIGDIHGCRVALENLANYVGFQEDDLIVTLGDYIDRGPDSKGVIDFLIELQQRHQVITLRGNHEVMMLAAREAMNPTRWLAAGGDETLESYQAKDWDNIPESHWEFLKKTRRTFETDGNLFVHANLDPGKSLDQQDDLTVFWKFLEDPEPHLSGKVMICGHSETGEIPLNLGHAICIDTGAYKNGWLTCLNVVTGNYWQANEAGKRRTGNLGLKG